MRARLQKLAPDLLVTLILFIVPLIFFFPQTLGGRTLIPAENLFQYEPYRSLAAQYGVGQPHNALFSDLILENYAWRQFVLQQARQGQLPLWQPNILAGTPFLAAGQSLTLYPFSVLYLILPLWMAYGWFTVVQLWIAGICMAVLVRVLGLRRAGALIAGLVYQLSGFFMASVVFPMILAAAAWLPLELAMIHLIVGATHESPHQQRKNPIPYVVVGAVGLAMVALAGHVEALYFTLLVMAFYAAWHLIALIARHPLSGLGRRTGGEVLRRAGWLLAMVALGLALGAAQIVPAYELASRSFREGAVTLDQVKGWAFPPRHVLAFLMPDFFGNPTHHQIFDLFSGRWQPLTANAAGQPITTTEWGIKNYVEGAAYVGILPLVLALLAAAIRLASLLRRRLSPLDGNLSSVNPPPISWREDGGNASSPLAFIVLSLLSLSFAFGTPAYNLLYYGLPFFNQSHSPFRWVWPLTLCIAVLAAYGVEYLTPREPDESVGATRESPLPNTLTKWAGWIGIAAGVILVFALAIIRLFYDRFDALITRVFNGFALAPNAFPDARAFFSYEAMNVALLAIMLILAGIVFILARRDSSVRLPSPLHGEGPGVRLGGVTLWHITAALVVVLDLFVASWGLHPASDPKLLDVVPPSIQWLKDRQAEDPLHPFRVMAYQAPGSTKTLNANIAWLNGLEDASGYDSLIPAQYVDYMKVIMPQGDLPYNRIAPVYEANKDALDSPLLDLLGVRYVISESEIANPRWQQVYQDKAVWIYENSGAMPRAFALTIDSTLLYGKNEQGLTDFNKASQNYDVRSSVLYESGERNEPVAEDLMGGGCFEKRYCFNLNFRPLTTQASPAAITVRSANEQWIDTSINHVSWLVFTDSYFPGWRAWVRPIGGADADEKEVPVYLVDGNFRGVILEPGRWTVRMKYSPDSFKFGGLISLLSALVVVFLLGVWVWPRLYREAGAGHEARRVAKNALTPIVLNLFNKGILFVLTFFSLRVLGPEGAGQYTYAVVIWGWFEILSNFGLNTFLTREVARHKDDAGRYLASTTILRLGLAVIGIPLLVGFIFARQMFVTPALDTATLWTIGLLYAGLFFSTISTGLTALFYAFEKAEYPAAIQTVSAFLTTGLGVAALLSGFGIVGLAVVSIVVNAVTLAILWSLARQQFGTSAATLGISPPLHLMERGLGGEALRESFPLMLNHLLATLFFRIDVVLLEAIKGAVVVGWYRIVYTWVDTVGLVPSLFTLALFPRMSRQAAEDRPALKRAYILALKLMTLLSVPMAIFTTLLAPVLVNILGGPQYLPHGALALQIFIWAMTVGWMNSVTQYVIIALNRQRTLTIAFVVGAAFNIVANLIYIPRYAYIAASLITILSEIVLWGVFYVVILSELGRVNWLATLWRVWAAGVVTGAVTFSLGSMNVWLALVVGVIVYGLAVLLLRPLDTSEMALVGGLLPQRIRDRLILERAS